MIYNTPFGIQNPAHVQGSILHIPTTEIYSDATRAPCSQSRSLRILQSIRKYGLSTPVKVTPIEVFPGTYRYLILEGEEIWRAACLANITQIPCEIAQNSPNEAEIAEIFAKITAKSSDMFEQAVLFRHLADTYSLTQEEIARRAGLSQSAVANKLRLLHLTAEEQKTVLLHGLSERHARALLRLRSPEERREILKIVCAKNLSVAATEALVEDRCAVIAQQIPDAPNAKIRLKTAILPQNPPKPEEKRPQKFVLHTLQPLYNSLERTLAIFRKTGREAVLHSEQTDRDILITITIPLSR